MLDFALVVQILFRDITAFCVSERFLKFFYPLLHQSIFLEQRITPGVLAHETEVQGPVSVCALFCDFPDYAFGYIVLNPPACIVQSACVPIARTSAVANSFKVLAYIAECLLVVTDAYCNGGDKFHEGRAVKLVTTYVKRLSFAVLQCACNVPLADELLSHCKRKLARGAIFCCRVLFKNPFNGNAVTLSVYALRAAANTGNSVSRVIVMLLIILLKT